MTWRIGRDEYRFERIIGNQFLACWIGRRAATQPGQFGALGGIQIGYRRYAHIRMILKMEGRTKSADAVSGDTHAYLAVRYGLPVSGSLGISCGLLEALDRRRIRPCGRQI